jgi:hypothetical protein
VSLGKCECVQVMSCKQTWDYYATLLEHLLMVCDLISVHRWDELEAFLHRFAKLLPGPVARSAMHSAISGTMQLVQSIMLIMLR